MRRKVKLMLSRRKKERKKDDVVNVRQFEAAKSHGGEDYQPCRPVVDRLKEHLQIVRNDNRRQRLKAIQVVHKPLLDEGTATPSELYDSVRCLSSTILLYSLEDKSRLQSASCSDFKLQKCKEENGRTTDVTRGCQAVYLTSEIGYPAQTSLHVSSSEPMLESLMNGIVGEHKNSGVASDMETPPMQSISDPSREGTRQNSHVKPWSY